MNVGGLLTDLSVLHCLGYCGNYLVVDYHARGDILSPSRWGNAADVANIAGPAGKERGSHIHITTISE